MKLKTLIIDDETSARSRLKKLLTVHCELEVIGEAENALQALTLIKQLQPDLLILDVQMPGPNGFEVLQALPSTGRLPQVIFATAYDEYALAAFEANAIGYLLKPINRDRLGQAVDRAHKLSLSEAQSSDEQERMRAAVKSINPKLMQIVAHKRDRFILLRLNQIIFFRMEGGLLRAKTEGESYWTDYQINELEARLSTPPFFRAHRAAIVNLQNVREIAPIAKSTYLLKMNDRDGSEIQVSERQAKKLRKLLW